MNEQQNPTIKHELLCKDIENLERRVTALEHSLYGNGSKGIKAELLELKVEIRTFKRIAVWQIGIGIAILCTLLSKWL